MDLGVLNDASSASDAVSFEFGIEQDGEEIMDPGTSLDYGEIVLADYDNRRKERNRKARRKKA